jgi:signal transduction histidine kinase
MCKRRRHSHALWVNNLPIGHTGWANKRRFVFFRFAAIFGVMIFLVLFAMMILLGLALGPLQPGLHRPEVVILLGCGLPIVFLGLASVFGSLAFRRFGTPLVDVMAAADAVADGDLTVRLRENIPGEMGRLAHSFNRMTAELERSVQQRRNLTADVAHELRTPLHIIQGNLEGILDGVYGPTSEHIQATLEETHLLARLVADLQTLSLAEAGQLPLHLTRVSVSDLLSDVASRFSGQGASRGVEIQVDILDDNGPLEVNADIDRLDQVLSNLVTNALRYTPMGGKIFIRAQPREVGIQMIVQDTGSGIPSEDLPYIFDRFWRGDRSRSRSRSEGAGSGLGLAIAKQLVLAHGGMIDVESQPGIGAKFTITLKKASNRSVPDE